MLSGIVTSIRKSIVGDDSVTVEWGGNTLHINREHLDAWHSKTSDQKVDWINQHPEAMDESVAIHRGEDASGTTKPEELVLVSWSGKKLLLERSQLEKWYNSSYEEHKDYADKHHDQVVPK